MININWLRPLSETKSKITLTVNLGWMDSNARRHSVTFQNNKIVCKFMKNIGQQNSFLTKY